MPYASNSVTVRNPQDYGKSNKLSGSQGQGGDGEAEKEWTGRAQSQRNMSIYVGPGPQNTQHPEWTRM